MSMQLGQKSAKVTLFDHQNDPDLPDHVKALPAAVRRRWVNAHNYHVTDFHDPAEAIRHADENTYMTAGEVAGMSKTKARKAPPPPDDDEQDPSEQEPDDDADDPPPAKAKPPKKASKSIVKSAVEFFSAFVRKESPRPFYVIKGKGDEPWRVFMVYSNNFKDNEAETISEAAHREYMTWAEKENLYPEYHLWHAGPDSRWGQVDFLDYVDGFAVSSGLVDKGKEYIAEELDRQARDNQLRVSHGYYGLKDAGGTYLLYRGFEHSPLPVGAEANSFTGAAFDLFSKESNMPFSSAKRTWLKEVAKLDDARITAMEGSFKDMSAQLQAAGVQFKEADPVAGSDATAVLVAEFKSFADGMNALATSVNGSKKEQDDKIAAIATDVAALKQAVTKSHEDIVADAYKAAAAPRAGGYVASEQSGSKVVKEGAQAGAYGGNDWFGEVVMPAFGAGIDAMMASGGAGAGATGAGTVDPAGAAAAEAAAKAAMAGIIGGGS